jgi:hypothetical protein
MSTRQLQTYNFKNLRFLLMPTKEYTTCPKLAFDQTFVRRPGSFLQFQGQFGSQFVSFNCFQAKKTKIKSYETGSSHPHQHLYKFHRKIRYGTENEGQPLLTLPLLQQSHLQFWKFKISKIRRQPLESIIDVTIKKTRHW